MNKQDDFHDKAKRLFDDSVERLDGATLSALSKRRHDALDRAGRRRVAARQWLPAVGVAAAAVIVVVLVQSPGTGVAPPADNVTDFELLISGDSLEMLEDLEFYSALDVIESDDVG
jgi:ferric-dicitrate binding protein FerR (iron transport regulator)